MFEPTAVYTPDPTRYESMRYVHSGDSGLQLPEVSLGLWHNFGDITPYAQMKEVVFTAFDNGITHFDLANNYGPEPGSAEKNFGRIMREYFPCHRDEMVISTKAGSIITWKTSMINSVKITLSTVQVPMLRRMPSISPAP